MGFMADDRVVMRGDCNVSCLVIRGMLERETVDW